MKSDAQSLIAWTIKHAFEAGESEAIFSIDGDYLAEFWVEWNGGLPIIGYKDLSTGATFDDVTAFELLKVLEAFQ